MKTKKIEVLAPAGNPAALKAAVFAGADAVYMGGSLFSARASAVNFSREEMREAVLFARERNVRVYVTVNTLLKDDELPEALDFCKFLCSVPVDGILIQDMGLFNILREACPEMHIHAFSPLEVTQGAATLGLPLREFLLRLKEAGLGTLPGTAAEILDDEVRAILCPDKLTTDQWLNVLETAHSVGLRTTSTIMYGHVERTEHWAGHLLRLRDLQSRTGGITEFVPLPFVAQEAPIYLKGGARPGPTFREAILMHAVARIALHPLIPNIQASWVKLGPVGVKIALTAGVNDLGGTLMNESITRAAGSIHGQEAPPETLEEWIVQAGRQVRQRTTTYGDAPATQRLASFGAAPLDPLVNTPFRKFEKSAPRKAVALS